MSDAIRLVNEANNKANNTIRIFQRMKKELQEPGTDKKKMRKDVRYIKGKMKPFEKYLEKTNRYFSEKEVMDNLTKSPKVKEINQQKPGKFSKLILSVVYFVIFYIVFLVDKKLGERPLEMPLSSSNLLTNGTLNGQIDGQQLNNYYNWVNEELKKEEITGEKGRLGFEEKDDSEYEIEEEIEEENELITYADKSKIFKSANVTFIKEIGELTISSIAIATAVSNQSIFYNQLEESMETGLNVTVLPADVIELKTGLYLNYTNQYINMYNPTSYEERDFSKYLTGDEYKSLSYEELNNMNTDIINWLLQQPKLDNEFADNLQIEESLETAKSFYGMTITKNPLMDKYKNLVSTIETNMYDFNLDDVQKIFSSIDDLINQMFDKELQGGVIKLKDKSYWYPTSIQEPATFEDKFLLLFKKIQNLLQSKSLMGYGILRNTGLGGILTSSETKNVNSFYDILKLIEKASSNRVSSIITDMENTNRLSKIQIQQEEKIINSNKIQRQRKSIDFI